MSRPRFLADHDLNEQILDGLLRREPTIETVRARDVDLDQRPDQEVLEYAARNRFLVLSHDVNTMTAAAYERIASGEPMTGLLIARQLDPLAPIIESLVLIWSASELEEWGDRVWFL